MKTIYVGVREYGVDRKIFASPIRVNGCNRGRPIASVRSNFSIGSGQGDSREYCDISGWTCNGTIINFTLRTDSRNRVVLPYREKLMRDKLRAGKEVCGGKPCAVVPTVRVSLRPFSPFECSLPGCSEKRASNPSLVHATEPLPISHFVQTLETA